MKILNKDILKQGFLINKLTLPKEVFEAVQSSHWTILDSLFKMYTSNEGFIYKYLQEFHEFNSIEYIIAIRDSQSSEEEDGIWHDDGSRFIAFSLSLTVDPIKGGVLEIRKRGKQSFKISTPSYGEIIIFLTGHYDYEHKINAVTDGKRIIIAGWCS